MRGSGEVYRKTENEKRVSEMGHLLLTTIQSAYRKVKEP